MLRFQAVGIYTPCVMSESLLRDKTLHSQSRNDKVNPTAISANGHGAVEEVKRAEVGDRDAATSLFNAMNDLAEITHSASSAKRAMSGVNSAHLKSNFRRRNIDILFGLQESDTACSVSVCRALIDIRMASKRGGARPGAGRPKGSIGAKRLPVIKLAQENSEQAFNVLVQIALDPSQPAAARITAANSILDRAYGKPVAPQEHGVTFNLADAFKKAGIKPQSMPIATAIEN